MIGVPARRAGRGGRRRGRAQGRRRRSPPRSCRRFVKEQVAAYKYPRRDLVRRRAAQGADGQDPQARDRAAGLTAVRAAALLAAAAAAAPTQAGSPWPTMRHDRAQHRAQPARGALRSGDRPWAFRHRARGSSRRPVIGADGTVYVGSADSVFYALDRRRPAALAVSHRRHHRRRRGDLALRRAPADRPLTFGSGDERLYQRAHGPRRRSRARGGSVWTFRASRARPATGQLVNWWEGNVGDRRPTATSSRQHGRRRPTRSTPAGTAALGLPDRQLGVDDAGVRARRHDVLGLARPQASSRSTADGARALDQRRRSATSSPRPRIAATARCTSAPSTASSTRSTPRRARERWSLPAPATTSTPRRRWRTGRRRDLHRLDRRLGLRARPGRPPALALRHRRRVRSSPVVGARRRAWGDRLRRAPPTARSTRSTPRPAGGAGPSTRPRASPCCATATTSTAHRRWAAAASYIGGEHGRVDYVPYDWCLRRPRRAAATRARASPSAPTCRACSPSARAAAQCAPAARRCRAADDAQRAAGRPPRRAHVDAAMQPAPAPRARRWPPAVRRSRRSSPATASFVHVVPRRLPARRTRATAARRRAATRRRASAAQSARPRRALRDTLRFRTAPRGPDRALRAGARRVSALSAAAAGASRCRRS